MSISIRMICQWQQTAPQRSRKGHLAITKLNDLLGLADALGLHVQYHAGRGTGYYLHHVKVISLRDDLTDRQLVSTLAHEIGHAIRGDVPTGTVFDQRAERAADHFAATYLISPVEYALAEEIHGTALDALANELGVTTHLLEVWRTLNERITT